MKSFKHLPMLAVTVLLFVSACSDFTTQPKLGTQTLEDYFSNPESAIQFVNGIYEGMHGDAWWKFAYFRMINTMATDNAWAGNIGQAGEQYRQFSTYTSINVGNSRISTHWTYNYRGITRANIAIEKIPELQFEDKKLQNRLVAEAKFLRAYFYMQLMKNFAVEDDRTEDGRGGVPVVSSYSEILKPEIYNYQRQPRDSVYSFIERDLREAAEVLPAKSSYVASDKGRATSGAAKAYLAKAHMFQHEFGQAKPLFEEVINSVEYSLNPNFMDIWSVDNFDEPGTIFSIKFAPNPGFVTGGVYGIITQSRNDPDNGWNWCTPTSHLENVYLEEGDEIRLRATIMKHGEPVYDKQGNVIVQSFDAAPNDNYSGRIWRKHYIPLDDRPRPYGRGQLPKDFILMRYAGLLLMHAEASYQTGDEAAALNSLKKVRDRVNLSTDMSLTGTALRDAIWKERRMELAGEFHRLFDLRRQMVDGKSRLAQVFGPNGSFVTYNTQENTDPFETRETVEPLDSGINFDISKHTAWPIPGEVVQRSAGRISQNPGY